MTEGIIESNREALWLFCFRARRGTQVRVPTVFVVGGPDEDVHADGVGHHVQLGSVDVGLRVRVLPLQRRGGLQVARRSLKTRGVPNHEKQFALAEVQMLTESGCPERKRFFTNAWMSLTTSGCSSSPLLTSSSLNMDTSTRVSTSLNDLYGKICKG